jgi:18S rRNA (guanine1575-N7)-methyltransferase
MTRGRKVPTQDAFVDENARGYHDARWMARIQATTTRRALALLEDERMGKPLSADDRRAGIVLDAGCGNGFSTAVILDDGFSVVVGVELSADMLALRDLDNPVVQADMARLPFRQEVVSVLVSISAMTFLSQQVDELDRTKQIYDSFARQLAGLIKPGGRGVIEFYPKSREELDIISGAFGSKSGFSGFLVVDKPGTRKEQKFLVFRREPGCPK